MQEADEGGGHDVPVFAAEFHRRLYPVVHHESQVPVDRVRSVIAELKREKKAAVRSPRHGEGGRSPTQTSAYLRSWTHPKGEKAPWDDFQVELLHGQLLFGAKVQVSIISHQRRLPSYILIFTNSKTSKKQNPPHE